MVAVGYTERGIARLVQGIAYLPTMTGDFDSRGKRRDETY